MVWKSFNDSKLCKYVYPYLCRCSFIVELYQRCCRAMQTHISKNVHWRATNSLKSYLRSSMLYKLSKECRFSVIDKHSCHDKEISTGLIDLLVWIRQHFPSNISGTHLRFRFEEACKSTCLLTA